MLPRTPPLLAATLAGLILSTANAQPAVELTVRTVLPSQTLPGIGAGQAACIHSELIYILGDADTGIIRECSVIWTETAAQPTPTTPSTDRAQPHLVPTGRDILCTRDGEDIAPHPTGLALHPDPSAGHPVFLGDTVRQTGLIFTIDWPRALADGDLDDAVLNTTVDDLAANGTRPVWVRFDPDASGPEPERWCIATADYGDEDNHLRLYDPESLAHASRTSAPGVLIAEFPCGPFVQSMAWIEPDRSGDPANDQPGGPPGNQPGWPGTLVLAQNRTPGLGYKLTFATLTPDADLRDDPSVTIDALTDELEGVAPLGGGRYLVLSSSREGNAHFVQLDGVP